MWLNFVNTIGIEQYSVHTNQSMAEPGPDANDQLGELLEKRYGGDKPQDLHIDLFYLILGKEIVGRCGLKIAAKLQQTPGITVHGNSPIKRNGLNF